LRVLGRFFQRWGRISRRILRFFTRRGIILRSPVRQHRRGRTAGRARTAFLPAIWRVFRPAFCGPVARTANCKIARDRAKGRCCPREFTFLAPRFCVLRAACARVCCFRRWDPCGELSQVAVRVCAAAPRCSAALYHIYMFTTSGEFGQADGRWAWAQAIMAESLSIAAHARMVLVRAA